jgi:hypothetical protein
MGLNGGTIFIFLWVQKTKFPNKNTNLTINTLQMI